jgi:hypothetical protein
MSLLQHFMCYRKNVWEYLDKLKLLNRHTCEHLNNFIAESSESSNLYNKTISVSISSGKWIANDGGNL